MTGPTSRTGADRCPGALQPFAAEDGLIVRARVPGGEVTVSTLRELMRIALEHGAPWIQLTTRANLQVRGLADPVLGDVADRMADAGLLPSQTHERARNILATPTNPRIRERARELDHLLCDRPALAALPGRFLMLLTDSSGLGLSEPFDIAYVDHGDGSGRLLAGVHGGSVAGETAEADSPDRDGDPGTGRDGAPGTDRDGHPGAGQNGLPGSGASLGRAGTRPSLGRWCRPADALEAMLDVAERFLAERADARVWNIRDLPPGAPVLDGMRPMQVPAAGPLMSGPAGPDLAAGVPLGQLVPAQLDAIASITDTVVVTPWRSILIEGGAPHADALSRAGLVTSARSTWARISACPGAPHCARAASETLNLARECASLLAVDGPRLHLVGCERNCGHPRGEYVSVIGARSVADVPSR